MLSSAMQSSTLRSHSHLGCKLQYRIHFLLTSCICVHLQSCPTRGSINRTPKSCQTCLVLHVVDRTTLIPDNIILSNTKHHNTDGLTCLQKHLTVFPRLSRTLLIFRLSELHLLRKKMKMCLKALKNASKWAFS